jgi:hypothetical protein
VPLSGTVILLTLSSGYHNVFRGGAIVGGKASKFPILLKKLYVKKKEG